MIKYSIKFRLFLKSKHQNFLATCSNKMSCALNACNILWRNSVVNNQKLHHCGINVEY